MHTLRNRRSFFAFALPLVALLGMFSLAACNTVEGFGEDLQSGGKAIEDKAHEEKHD